MKYLGLFFSAVAAVAITAALSPMAQGQTTKPQIQARHSVGPTYGFTAARDQISDKTHAPFSGMLVQTMEQVLNDGTRIRRENRETVMRDSMGRVYRAREIEGYRPNAGERLHSITITDPIAHIQYMCGPSPLKRCTRMPYRRWAVRRRAEVLAGRRLPDVEILDLGTSNISGVEAVGQRITRTIPEGSEGNDRAFNVIQEKWHSADLGLDMKVEQSDPRRGTWTTVFTDFNLGEPDPKFFQVPDGYKVGEMRRPLEPMAPMAAGPGPNYPNGILGDIIPPNR